MKYKIKDSQVKKIKLGDIKSYRRDYSNLNNSEDITGEEFKEFLESNFPEYHVPLIQKRGHNTYETHSLGEEVYTRDIKPGHKKSERVMYNKLFICNKLLRGKPTEFF